MANQINLAELTEVPNITRRKKQNYHVKYVKDGKFRISDNARVLLNIENHGLKLHIHPNTGQVLLSSQGEEDSDFMKRRGEFDKGSEFTNRKMRKFLNRAGYKGQSNFQLEKVGNQDGADYFLVSPWENDDEEDEVEVLEDVTDEIADEDEEEDTEDLAEEEEEEIDEEEEEDDDFDLDDEDLDLDEDEDPFA